jgi:hypothetical protein
MGGDTVDIYDCGMRQSCNDGPFCKAGGAALANEITSQIIERAPSAFGKLVLLSSLCNRSAGAYHHPALEKVVPSCLASLVLRKSHEQAFSIWLEKVLEEQWKEVGEYLAATEAGEAATQGKARGKSWDTLLPEAAHASERELFLSDLELVLSVLEK